MEAPDDLWVFAYGSLVFDPGFALAESRPAVLHGFRRRFCMWSIHHRGSEADPGLVLALEAHAGASCRGLALRPADPEAALPLLRERELISSAYHEATVELEAEGGARIASLAYVIDPAHRQYAPDLSLEEQARIIARARGGRGANADYLFRSAEALAQSGMRDGDLDWLVARVQQVRAAT
jgi:cation transport protein ChaC